MCGRYTMTVDKGTIERHFGARFVSGHFEHYEPRYNAAPSQMLPIIRTYGPDTIELATWGFWPENWKRTNRMSPQINARLDTADEKPMFHTSFRGRHCLADSYYEW
jgi:putative SOS response-associated peptidase YedK